MQLFPFLKKNASELFCCEAAGTFQGPKDFAGLCILPEGEMKVKKVHNASTCHKIRQYIYSDSIPN